MAGSKKTSKSKKTATPSKPANPGVLSRLCLRLFRPAPLMMLALVISAIVLAPYVPWLLPKLEERPEYQFALADAEVTPAHDWVPVTLTQQIMAEAALPETVSLLSDDLCREVAQAWAKNAWIRKVNAVRITGDHALRIDVEYRLPVAFVEVSQGLYPVDEAGVLLPPVDFSLSDTARLPHIRQVQTLPQGAAGVAWGDGAVLAAARLAAVIAPDQNLELYWNRYGFDAILVPESEQPVPAEEVVLEIATRHGSHIVWGKAPGADSLEPTVEQKLARLDYLERFGTLDSQQHPQRIDIRLFDGISLQPLHEGVLR